MLLSEKIYQVGKTDIPVKTKQRLKIISSASELPDDKAVILLSCLKGEAQDDFLQQVHRSCNGWRNKIYVAETSHYSRHLSDGLFEQVDLDKAWQVHNDMLVLIKDKPSDTLLAWLWLDKSRRLIPYLDARNESIYSYPLLSSLRNEEHIPYHYLSSETENHYLDQDEFVDRIHQCSSCKSGHLNYTETCPECRSHNLRQVQALHCFNCDYVGEQSDFRHSGQLTCPKCHMHLKHPDVDYAKSFNDLKCNSCNADISEPVLRAHCLSCGDRHDISGLITRSLYTYRIGDNAQHLMLYGERYVSPKMSVGKLVDENYFTGTLEWMNRLAQRHEHKHMLLALQVINAETVTKEIGEAGLMQFFQQLAVKLSTIHRATDVSCQYHTDTLCILLPMTDEHSTDKLIDKIEALPATLDLHQLCFKVALWPIPDESMEEDAEGWLNRKLDDFQGQ